MLRINDRIQHLLGTGGACYGPLTYEWEVIIICICCFLGIIWAIIQIIAV